MLIFFQRSLMFLLLFQFVVIGDSQAPSYKRWRRLCHDEQRGGEYGCRL